MICKGCKHLGTKNTPKPAQFLIYRFELKKLDFGVGVDLMKNIPKNCKEKEK